MVVLSNFNNRNKKEGHCHWRFHAMNCWYKNIKGVSKNYNNDSKCVHNSTSTACQIIKIIDNTNIQIRIKHVRWHPKDKDRILDNPRAILITERDKKEKKERSKCAHYYLDNNIKYKGNSTIVKYGVLQEK